MNSSGIKRGVAATAISALAVTGLPALAFADSLGAASQTTEVQLVSVSDDGAVTVKNDGTNSTVSLVAVAPDAVGSIQFAYRTPSAPAVDPANETEVTPIGAPVSRDASGEFKTEWTPSVTLLNTDVDIFAFEVNGLAQGDPANPAGANEESVATAVTVSGSVNGVEITDEEPNGYFVQPYADAGAGTVGNGDAHQNNVLGFEGTTSNDAVSVTVVNGVGTTAGTAKVDDRPAGSPASTPVGFSATANATAAAINGTTKQALARVTNGGAAGTLAEDAEAFNLYSQTIAGITSEAANSNVPTGDTTSVTVTVNDQNGKPVSGAHVAAISETAPSSPGTTADAYTDGRGQVVFTGATAGTHRYYVDASNAGGFTNGVDRSTTVTVGTFDPTPSEIEFTSQDGSAFDWDEYDSTEDTYVTVVDQNGNPVEDEFFFYSFEYTPFEPSATNVAQTFTGQAQTGADGTALIPLPTNADSTGGNTADQLGNGGTGGSLTLSGYVNVDGTPPGQDPADLAMAPETIKTGESVVTWNGPATIDRQAGSDQTFSGMVELEDGTDLGGRRLTVDYTPGDEGNAGPAGDGNSVLAPQSAQPAGTTRVNNTSAIVITQADGSFSVVVRDPATAAPVQQSEEGGAQLVATGTAAVPVTAPDTNNEGIGTDATDTVTVNFLRNATAGSIVLVADSDTTALEDDPYEELIDNEATPGRPVTFRIRVMNGEASPAPLAGQEVTLTTDHGFFTDTATNEASLEADPEPSNGSLYGEWADNGQTTTVTTDGSGYAYVTVAIEKDAGFDDDGKVTSNITATSGGASNSEPIKVAWTSEDALNPGSLSLEPATDQARVGNDDDLNVFAEDQFGNLTEAAVVLSDDTPDADIDDTTVDSQFTNDDAETYAFADSATTQNITATWNTESNVYRDSSNAPGFQAQNTTTPTSVTDEATIEWYEAAVSDDSVTMTSNASDRNPVGTAVTETVTVLDQEGNPVAGMDVTFTRQGPGDADDSVTKTTNSNGRAFYTFVGTERGSAYVTAVVETGAEPVVKTDEVVFGDKKNPGLVVKGYGHRAGDDDIIANARKTAAGATVKLFRKTKNGKKFLEKATLNAKGNHKFNNIKDKNGRKKTKYKVIVKPTDTTSRGKGGTRVH